MANGRHRAQREPIQWKWELASLRHRLGELWYRRRGRPLHPANLYNRITTKIRKALK